MIPIFRKGPGPYALAEAMTGVRLGDRLLYIGTGDPRLLAALAAKAGLTGQAHAIVDSAAGRARVEEAAARAGVLIEVEVAPPSGIHPGEGQFDVAVVDATGGFVLALPPAEREALVRGVLGSLRGRGRAIVVEREPRGVRAWWQGRSPGLDAFRASGGAVALLEGAGFHPVRLLGEREGQRFTEGWKATGADRPA